MEVVMMMMMPNWEEIERAITNTIEGGLNWPK